MTASRNREHGGLQACREEPTLAEASTRAGEGAEMRTPDAGNFTAEYVIARLQEACSTLAAMRVSGTRPAGYRSSMPEIVRNFWDCYQSQGVIDIRLPQPTARDISNADEALAWVALIPADRYVLRRLVLARSIMRRSGRPAQSWRDLGDLLGASHTAVKGWFDDAISLIVRKLNAPDDPKRGGPMGAAANDNRIRRVAS